MCSVSVDFADNFIEQAIPHTWIIFVFYWLFFLLILIWKKIWIHFRTASFFSCYVSVKLLLYDSASILNEYIIIIELSSIKWNGSQNSYYWILLFWKVGYRFPLHTTLYIALILYISAWLLLPWYSCYCIASPHFALSYN